MNSILLLTAISATTGIFGGGRQQCTTGTCPTAYATPATYQAAPNGYYQGSQACATGSCGTTYAAAPAPQYHHAPAPAHQAVGRGGWLRGRRMSQVVPTANCANGTCYRR
jgi:hypothetical protein